MMNVEMAAAEAKQAPAISVVKVRVVVRAPSWKV